MEAPLFIGTFQELFHELGVYAWMSTGESVSANQHVKRYLMAGFPLLLGAMCGPELHGCSKDGDKLTCHLETTTGLT